MTDAKYELTTSTNNNKVTINIPSSSFIAKYLVEGMTCSSCVNTVETGVKKGHTINLKRVNVNLLEDTMEVTFSEDDLEKAKVYGEGIVDTVECLGFDCKLLEVTQLHEGKQRKLLTCLLNFEMEKSIPNTVLVNLTNDIITYLLNVNEKYEDSISKVSSTTTDQNQKNNNKMNVNEIELFIEFNDEIIGIRTICEEYIDPVLKKFKVIKYDVAAATGTLSTLQSRKNNQVNQWKKSLYFSLIFTAPCFLISMVLPSIHPSIKMAFMSSVFDEINLHWGALLMWILATPVQFISGQRFYVEAYHGMLRRSYGMSFLIALGTSAAYFYSAFAVIYNMLYTKPGVHTKSHQGAHFFETSAMLITFVLLGKFMEATAKKETSSALAALMKLSASTARLVVQKNTKNDNVTTITDEDIDEIKDIDIVLLQRGDIIKVLPGDTLPADGIVIKGRSTVNESMLTGEPMPVQKNVGDLVSGSTSNVDGTLFISVTETGANTTLSNIINLVQDAQTKKPPIQIFADRISGIFAPVVASISLLTFIVWIILTSANVVPKEWYPYGESNFVMSLTFSIAVLVIACPCALGLATPTAIMVGTSVGAKLGILVKSGDALETAHNVTDVIFDKTGTLTSGTPSCTDIVLLNDKVPLNMKKKTVEEQDDTGNDFLRISQHDLLYFVGCAEKGSEHPLAQAIVKKASSVKNVKPLKEPGAFKADPGRGICADVDGHQVLIGNRQYMEEKGSIFTTNVERTENCMQTMEKKGKTSVIVSINNVVVGVLGIYDEAKQDAAVALAGLRAMKLNVWMLTGDNRRTAEAIAFELGIPKEQIVAEVLPGEKSEKVVELQEKGKIVAMVGDGVNDSPALAQANLGIAIGAGADVAVEAADLVLVKSRLVDVITAIDLSRVTYQRIRLNMFWALGYNTLGIPIAAGVLFPLIKVVLPPEVAGLAMAMSSVSVVISSILLRNYKPPKIESSYGREVRQGTLGIESVKMELESENNGGGGGIAYHIDPGCMMAYGGACTCAAELCTCADCAIHKGGGRYNSKKKSGGEKDDGEEIKLYSAGCSMQWGEKCNCDPSKCTCADCMEHKFEAGKKA